LENISITYQLPQMLINGQLAYPALIDIETSDQVDYSQLNTAGKIIVQGVTLDKNETLT